MWKDRWDVTVTVAVTIAVSASCPYLVVLLTAGDRNQHDAADLTLALALPLGFGGSTGAAARIGQSDPPAQYDMTRYNMIV